MCKCQCMVIGRCRFKVLKTFGIGLVLAGVILVAFGIAAFFNWDHFTNQTAGAPIWAGLVAIVTGICSFYIASTLSDDDWGTRGLVCFTLLAVVTMVASVALIGWKLWENDYFVSKDEFENGDSTDWRLTIILFSLVSFVGLLVVIASTIIGCIGCRCSEGYESSEFEDLVPVAGFPTDPSDGEFDNYKDHLRPRDENVQTHHEDSLSRQPTVTTHQEQHVESMLQDAHCGAQPAVPSVSRSSSTRSQSDYDGHINECFTSTRSMASSCMGALTTDHPSLVHVRYIETYEITLFSKT